MTWFILTLACIILWSVADILYKASWDYNDPLSHQKIFVWIGIIMAMAGWIMASWSNTLMDSIQIVKENLYFIPLSLFYAGSLFVGLLGIKYLAASVISPLENIDGAISAILLYLYYVLSGAGNVMDGISVLDIIATVIIVVGIIVLAVQEQSLSKQEAHLSHDKKKHRLGALALIFPFIYNLADTISITAVGLTVSGNASVTIPEIDFFILECAAFVCVAICIWLYMLIFKKYAYNPFRAEEIVRCGAATGETFGTMTFIFAAGSNPNLTAPIASSYCVLTLVLARIFLKERLAKKQYICLGILLLGIALLGISDIID